MIEATRERRKKILKNDDDSNDEKDPKVSEPEFSKLEL